MSVNLFGMPFTERIGEEVRNLERSRSANDGLRNYVRDNTLALHGEDYDAKNRKIRRVSAPDLDTDVANKMFIENALRDLKKEFRHSLDTLNTSVSSRINIVEIKCDKNTSEIDSVSSRITKSHKELINRYEAINILTTQNQDAITELSNTKASADAFQETNRLALENQEKIKDLASERVTKQFVYKLLEILRKQIEDVSTILDRMRVKQINIQDDIKYLDNTMVSKAMFAEIERKIDAKANK
jgi:hypothetical protein